MAGWTTGSYPSGAAAFDPKYSGFYKGSDKKSGEGLDKAFPFLQSFLDKMGKTPESTKARMYGGGEFKTVGGSTGTGGLQGELHTVHSPVSGAAPLVIEGTSDSGSGFGQRFARAGSGALSGFQAGAATGIPHLAGIGAVVGLSLIHI